MDTPHGSLQGPPTMPIPWSVATEDVGSGGAAGIESVDAKTLTLLASLDERLSWKEALGPLHGLKNSSLGQSRSTNCWDLGQFVDISCAFPGV